MVSLNTMNWKNKFWKYATTIVIIFIVLNPEMIELALFIDAIGLEMFLMLLEIQALTILSAYFNIKKIKNTFNQIKYLFLPANIILIMPTAATLMVMLVLSAFIINFF